MNRSVGPIERIDPCNGKQRDDAIISPKMMRVAVRGEKRIAVEVVNGGIELEVKERTGFP